MTFDVKSRAEKIRNPPEPAKAANPAKRGFSGLANLAGLAVGPGSENFDLVSNSNISRISSQPGIKLSDFGITLEYIDDPIGAVFAIQGLEKEALLAIDIETARQDSDLKSGLDPYRAKIRLIQIYTGKDKVIIFDVFDHNVWKEIKQSSIWQVPMVAHNATFEMKHLSHAGIQVDNIGCTLLQSNSIEGDLPKLSTLVSRYLNKELPKALQTSDWSGNLTNEQLEYAALDAVVTYKIANIQAKRLRELKRVPVYQLMKTAQQAVVSMELSGFLFDAERHKKLVKTWQREQIEARDTLDTVMGGINPASGAQLAGWLETVLDKDRLETWPKTNKGQLKTDIGTFSRYPEIEAVQPLLLFKNLSKKLTTYGLTYQRYIHPVTGRIHANYRLGGNITGRLPCRDPNLQQVPRDPAFRSLFIAPPGKQLLVADYSQIQLRIAALLSQDEAMLDAFNRGVDLHKVTAAAILAIPANQVTKDQRQMAKAVSFGLLFGQGAKGLQRYAKQSYGVDMSLDDAQTARSTYFKTYSGLKRWQLRTGVKAKRENKVCTPGGRVREFSREAGGYVFTEALNTPIQGAEAEVLMHTLSLLPKKINGHNIRLVNAIHDELVFEVSDTVTSKKIVEDSMTEGFLRLFPQAGDMTEGLVEAHTGQNWQQAK